MLEVSGICLRASEDCAVVDWIDLGIPSHDKLHHVPLDLVAVGILPGRFYHSLAALAGSRSFRSDILSVGIVLTVSTTFLIVCSRLPAFACRGL